VQAMWGVGSPTGPTMALFFSRAADVEELPTDGGRMVLWRLGRSILVSQASGRPGVEHIGALIRRSDELIARVGAIDVVHDWFGVVGYGPEVRQVMTPWAYATRKQHRCIHIGTSAGLVRMGVTMVRLATGAPIHAHERPASLEAALAALM
jgi:hypothetical protein